ncbi:phage coat protein [Ramlibacter humi]|uniref:phage coat protein n=1 Tax=Ramlibacter humi TaxID=2530451 RepID=UPI001EF09BE9|nr:phage coat protein [Ramlibacter humi]
MDVDPTTAAVVVVGEASSCSTPYVVLRPAEVDALASSSASPFRLTLAEGSAVSVAILGVWATAWAFKALSRALKAGDPET